MITMKRIYKKLLCYIVTIALVMTTLAVPPVSVAAKETDIDEVFREEIQAASEEQKKYAEEAYEDYKSDKSSNDWYNACQNPEGIIYHGIIFTMLCSGTLEIIVALWKKGNFILL